MLLRTADDRIRATPIAFGATTMEEFTRIAADRARRVAFESRKTLLALPPSKRRPA